MMSEEKTFKISPHLKYANDFPEIIRLDITLDSFLSRMNKIQEIIERGGFSGDIARDALVGPPEYSEEVAKWLRGELSQLREDEKKTSNAPVLSGTSLGRATISDIAITMLDGIEPGPQLLLLLAELLNVDRHRKARADKKSAAKSIAAQIEAQYPAVGVRELAKMVGVAPSTIIEWQKDTSYHESVGMFKRINSGDTLFARLKKIKNTKIT